MIYVVQKKLDRISIRLKAIQRGYKNINNLNLKIRLLREHENLKINFFEIKSIVKLIDQSSSDQLIILKLLKEQCSRCEREFFKNEYLFSA